ALMRWVRSQPEELNDSQLNTSGPWAALYQWLANYPANGDGIDQMRSLAWKALQYTNEAVVDPALAKQLFPSPLTVTARQLERFATCPFAHYVEYGLGIEMPEEEDPTSLDLGTIYHQTLERLVRLVITRNLDMANLPADLLEKQIQACSQEIAQTLRGELMLSNARNRHL